MSIQDSIKAQIKEAMIAKDAVRLTVVRGLVSAFTNELVAKQRMPTDKLTDDEAMAVIKRAVKQRKDSIDQFTKGGRPELAVDEQAELAILEKFLPKMMSQDEIRPIAEKKIAEFNGDKTKMGQIMGAIMKETKGLADGNDVKAVVESLLK